MLLKKHKIAIVIDRKLFLLSNCKGNQMCKYMKFFSKNHFFLLYFPFISTTSLAMDVVVDSSDVASPKVCNHLKLKETKTKFSKNTTYINNNKSKEEKCTTNTTNEKTIFKEIPFSLNNENKSFSVSVPYKLSMQDIALLDKKDITTPQCIPYAFKSRIFPLIKENNLEKAASFTFAFVWNNPLEHDEIYAQLGDFNQDIIHIVKKGKETPELFAEAEKQLKEIFLHLVPENVTLQEEISYDNPFAVDDLLASSLTENKREERSTMNPHVFKEEW